MGDCVTHRNLRTACPSCGVDFIDWSFVDDFSGFAFYKVPLWHFHSHKGTIARMDIAQCGIILRLGALFLGGIIRSALPDRLVGARIYESGEDPNFHRALTGVDSGKCLAI